MTTRDGIDIAIRIVERHLAEVRDWRAFHKGRGSLGGAEACVAAANEARVARILSDLTKAQEAAE